MYKYRVCRDVYLISIIIIGIFLIGGIVVLFLLNEATIQQLLIFVIIYLLLGMFGNFLLPKRVISEKGLTKGKRFFGWDDIVEISIKENSGYVFEVSIFMWSIKRLFFNNSDKYTKYNLVIKTCKDIEKFYINEKALNLIKQYVKCEMVVE